ncbi:cytochrome c [Oceanobacillus piezotolerans]|uniref:Cytochrome c n=1 Tax=Oceanobacillus piezotolerans TaxID=2448030 RepID=A0A498DAP5_9BACI|nr:cytochrome c [Oceanobacillus piezotolerans]RLL46648.1 cytochrome c [Oceanobacillus piezotolerans]
MKKSLLTLFFLSMLALAACGDGEDGASEEPDDNGAAETEQGETVSAGEEEYATNCAACHGADLSGGVGPALNQIGSKYTQDEIAEIVQNGIGTMPAQSVAGEELENLTSWLAEKQ